MEGLSLSDILIARSSPGNSSSLSLNFYFFVFLDTTCKFELWDSEILLFYDFDIYEACEFWEGFETREGKILVSWIYARSTMLEGTLISWNSDCSIFLSYLMYSWSFSYFSFSSLAYSSSLSSTYCFRFLYSSNYLSKSSKSL